MAVIGCNMGKNHALACERLDAYELVAVCDLIEEKARDLSRQTKRAKAYTDVSVMLAEQKPDVVCIATPNTTHKALTLQAADAGVRGIYCEKPMAANLADARMMADICKSKGIPLVIGHQRRMLTEFRKMRELMEAGEIGEIRYIRGQCAGDMLTDGTHTIDTIMYLLDDADASWVIGQIYRKKAEESADPNRRTGWRYGHAVENGAISMIQFQNGVRAEVFTGEMRYPERGYQDIEVVGTKGRLWRPGDYAERPLLLSQGASGQWSDVPLENNNSSRILDDVFAQFAETIRHGTPHPMNADVALKGMELLIAVFESARLNNRVELPIQQDRFPLELLIEEGRI
jgi:predicted dehydrogenase